MINFSSAYGSPAALSEQNRRHGFTLIELLVVVAIIATSNNFPAYRISSSLPKSPGAFHEISRILVQNDWK